jgi:uncharacterized protein (TIGR00251 family)
VGIRLAGGGSLSDPPFLRRNSSGVAVELRVQPHARRTSLGMSGMILKGAVTAPPEEGKANAAVVALLAESWRLPKSAFAIVRGGAARNKTVSVAGDPAMVAARIEEWLKTHG